MTRPASAHATSRPLALMLVSLGGMLLGGTAPAAAQNIALSFDVPDRPAPPPPPPPPPVVPPIAAVNPVRSRLPVPEHGKLPPIATGESRTFATVPPPPTIAATAGVIARRPDPVPPPVDQPTAIAAKPAAPVEPTEPNAVVEAVIDFALPTRSAPPKSPLVISSSAPVPATMSPAVNRETAPERPRSLEGVAASLDTQTRTNWIFAGGSQSLVARAIGHAEGTRTATGDYTSAYNGHRDPGNGKHNLGTFSYQHGAPSPEAADRLQLNRLRQQHQVLQAKAAPHQLQPTLAEELNALDLANQSPRAALSELGYMDRLAQAHQMGLRGEDAVLWARTRSFLDPDTGRWNASGLGNDGQRITADQERRMRAIAAVMRSDQISIQMAPVSVSMESQPPTDQETRAIATTTQAPATVPQGIAQADAATSPLFTPRATAADAAPTLAVVPAVVEEDEPGLDLLFSTTATRPRTRAAAPDLPYLAQNTPPS